MVTDANHTGPQQRACRIQLLIRDQGLLEASVSLADGQALAPYLGSRRGSFTVRDALWVQRRRRMDEVTLKHAEIVWARALETDLVLMHVLPAQRENMSVEVSVAGGQVLRGRFPMLPGQSVSDFLGAVGTFPVLWDATIRGGDGRRGHFVLNQAAIQSVREIPQALAPAPQEREVQRSDNGVQVHWLVRTARQLGLPGAEALALPAGAPIATVWRAVCQCAGLEEETLAQRVADVLRLELVDTAAAAPRARDRIPDALADRYGVVGYAEDGRTLTVATADPMSADAEQALAFACKRRIVFALATPTSLNLAPAALQASEAELDSLLASLAPGDGVRIEEDLEPSEVEVDDVAAEPVIKLANLILREGVRQNASDIHLEPEQSRGLIRFRVDGVLRPFMHVPPNTLHRVISRYKVVGGLDIADRIRPQDGRVRVRIDGKRYELRLSTVPTQEAEKAVIRIAGSVAEQTLDQLELPDHELHRLRQLLGYRDGIIIVSGPTGAGKTTTLYAALHELNTGKVNIMTVEDPIERALAGTTQMQVAPRRGVTFASALRAILRQDPDVILLGEIRDLETAEIAVQAAMTGHLVLTTLHTTTAVGVVSRLRDLGLDAAGLAGSLRGVIAQRLARRVCTCSGAGCGRCGGSGYRGRVPLLEVLTAGPAFTELVGRGALIHDLQRSAVEHGMRPIRDVALERVSAGITTAEEVLRVLGDADQDTHTGPHSGRDAMLRLADDELLALPPADRVPDKPQLPALPAPEHAGLPARMADLEDDRRDTHGRRRADIARGLLQGLDRCLAEGQPAKDVLHFACEQLAAAFDAPLVWIATLDDGRLGIQARAGACAPYVRDIVPDWDDLESSDGAVATALRTGTPQGRRLDEEPGFDSWREHARAHGLPIFLAVPMEAEGGAVGVVGLHPRSMEGLDRHAGQELINLVDRITGVVQRLRELEAVGLQLSALELAADAVFTTDRRGIIQWVNRSFIQLSGYTAAEAIGQSPRILRSDRHDAAFFGDLWNTILGGRAWRGELFNLRKDGTSFVVEQTITPIANERNEITHFLAVQRDISERKQREQNVQQLVSSDAQTGLPNARALEVELTRAVAAAAAGEEAALLLVRVDGCNAVGSSLGRVVAEQLVIAVARVLESTLRPGDYLARLGDDEFAALLLDTPRQGSVIVADRLRSAVARQAFAIDGLTIPPTISIGIAAIDGTQGARAVLATADAALYGARDRRDDVIVTGGGATETEHAADAEWARRIGEAVRDDMFVLHFQPVVRLDSRSLSHYDVLLRMHDQEGEAIPARAFIMHAEALGLMPQIDRWVVDNVLRLLHTSPDLRVSLNLSTSTVVSPSFRQFLQRQSRRMSAVGARVIFEVAEVATPQQLPRMLDNMNRLRELGCRFVLDNFGIGGASLASLGTLPVDYVKLDGSLVRGIDMDSDRHEIVRALTTVARALGKEVIAGWAETESVVRVLPGLGIELAQGHYLGHPGPELRREVLPPVGADEHHAEPARVRGWRPRLAV